MPVAKSYIGLKQLTEPYEKNNKMYIVVELKSGKSKEEVSNFFMEKFKFHCICH